MYEHGFPKHWSTLKKLIWMKAASGSSSTTIGVRWDMVNAQMVRVGDFADITTDTTNFGHFGAENPNYSNPFDSIYPWSGRKLCNIDIDLYRGLQHGDSLKQCVTAWEGQSGFSYEHANGVWVYTPAFWGRSYDSEGYRYFEVSAKYQEGFLFYPESIAGRYLGCDVTMTIDGASKHVNLPKVGMPMANVSGANMHQYAKNMGASLMDIYTLDALTLLYLVEYANYNVQLKIGNGISDLYRQNETDVFAEDSTGNVVHILKSAAARVIPHAIMDIGTSSGGMQVGRYEVISAETNATDDTVLDVTLDRSVTANTANIWSIHGGTNVADEAIGSKSGYIGSNGQHNAYYRGQIFYGNKWSYILGAYREKDTAKIWTCDREAVDSYDALNTSAHHDTGLALPAASGWVKTFGLADGFSAAPFCTAVGGSSNAPVGDYCYVPSLSTANTVLWFGGGANLGAGCGFCGYWNAAASYSYWGGGSSPRLKTP